MLYTYDVYRNDDEESGEESRVDTTTRLEEIRSYNLNIFHIMVTDNLTNTVIGVITSDQEMIAHIKKLTEDQINPTHYQDFVQDLQWIETMQYIIPNIEAGMELMTRKYMDRRGKKDPDIQELGKGMWWYRLWLAYLKNDKKPVLVKDIEDILKKDV